VYNTINPYPKQRPAKPGAAQSWSANATNFVMFSEK
jgi:hypothetical protein